MNAPKSTRALARVLIAAVFAATALTSCSNLFGPNAHLSDFQRESLEEMNFLRTDPAAYARQRLLDDYESSIDNGAYNDIRNRDPVGALASDAALMQTAQDYATYLAANNVFGHNEDGSPSDRAQRNGYDHGVGENIAAASYTTANGDESPAEAAKLFVKQLVIDMGVPGVGHRENLMRADYRVIGIGFAHDADSTFKNYTVQNFGMVADS